MQLSYSQFHSMFQYDFHLGFDTPLLISVALEVMQHGRVHLRATSGMFRYFKSLWGTHHRFLLAVHPDALHCVDSDVVVYLRKVLPGKESIEEFLNEHHWSRSWRKVKDQLRNTYMFCKCSGDTGKVKVALQKHDNRLDEIEQYSRRDNIVVHGLPEQDGECTNDVIIGVAAAAGVVITNSNISTSHRVGRPGNARDGKPRPIVARFVRRDTRTGFLRSKKKLKGHAAYNGMFLSEQLSPMRAKLLHAVKNDADTARTRTLDGKIFCTKRADPDGKRYVLTSPDDLFKQFGWGEDKLKKSGLFVD